MSGRNLALAGGGDLVHPALEFGLLFWDLIFAADRDRNRSARLLLLAWLQWDGASVALVVLYVRYQQMPNNLNLNLSLRSSILSASGTVSNAHVYFSVQEKHGQVGGRRDAEQRPRKPSEDGRSLVPWIEKLGAVSRFAAPHRLLHGAPRATSSYLLPCSDGAMGSSSLPN
jgi:hypothetical protein